MWVGVGVGGGRGEGGLCVGLVGSGGGAGGGVGCHAGEPMLGEQSHLAVIEAHPLATAQVLSHQNGAPR